uniref:Uncharacterized protein n=1 Tax=Anguilla anguilla TaxID=7936 RepID=A0A0E9SK52_ANGAN
MASRHADCELTNYFQIHFFLLIILVYEHKIQMIAFRGGRDSVLKKHNKCTSKKNKTSCIIVHFSPSFMKGGWGREAVQRRESHGARTPKHITSPASSPP